MRHRHAETAAKLDVGGSRLDGVHEQGLPLEDAEIVKEADGLMPAGATGMPRPRRRYSAKGPSPSRVLGRGLGDVRHTGATVSAPAPSSSGTAAVTRCTARDRSRPRRQNPRRGHPERLEILRAADAIVQAEVERFEFDRETWQSFAVFLPVKTVGEMGDKRTCEHVIALRVVGVYRRHDREPGLPAEKHPAAVSRRISSEVNGVNRVVLDISSQPPSTIEWE